jgi:hypothetical protein
MMLRPFELLLKHAGYTVLSCYFRLFCYYAWGRLPRVARAPRILHVVFGTAQPSKE